MTTAYTPVLKLALPVTGELGGTWGTVVNDNITSMVEQAIAGLSTISSWTANSHTLTTADGTTSESRCAMLVLVSDGSGNPSAAATVICPNATKLYVVKNTSGQTATIKTAAGTGVAVSNGDTTFVFCDGTNVNSVVTSIVNGHVTGNLTVDGTTSLQGTTATQVDITAQGDLRLQDSTGGEYVAIQAPTTVTASYTLTLPIDDGTSGQALITDGSGNLSWSSAASGDVYGPASATDNAVARYDGTTGKLIQNSAVTIADDGSTVIAANSSVAGLRITQLGAGNALTVEDEANPDTTIFSVNNAGNVLVGGTAIVGMASSFPNFQITGYGDGTIGTNAASVAINGFIGTGSASQALNFNRSNGAAVGINTIVANGDQLGNIRWGGADGTNYIRAAQITGEVDGTPGTNDMPGRLVFSTTADGASSPTERMRIDNAGRVGVGGTNALATIYNARTLNFGANNYGFALNTSAGTGTTGEVVGYNSYIGASTGLSFGQLIHYRADQATLNASTVTSQYGFFASSGLTGATNNYGFHSNIASGTGRYNFYAGGTAANFFEGATTVNSNLGVKTTASAEYNILIAGNLTGGVNCAGVRFQSQIQSDVTSNARGVISIPSTAAAAFTLSNLEHFYAGQGSLGAGSAITSQYGYRAASTLTGATNNYGFYGDIASGTGRWNFYAAGTADNFFAGKLGIGAVPTAVNINIYGGSNATGATGVHGIQLSNQVQSDVTNFYYANNSTPSTAAATFTLATLTHYRAGQGTFGVGSTVTNQYGFQAVAGLTGATNNYGFHSAIASGTGRYNFYAAGTADNYFAGILGVGALPLGTLSVALPTGRGIGTAWDSKSALFGGIGSFTGALGVSFDTTNGAILESAAPGVAGYPISLVGSIAKVFTSNVERGRVDGTGVWSLGAAPGSESLRVTPVASAVNYFESLGAATGGTPTLYVSGSDANISSVITAKGTGNVQLRTGSGNQIQFIAAHTASAVNYLQVSGGATNSSPFLAAQGSDANIHINYLSKGTYGHIFTTGNGSNVQFYVSNTASAVNYLQVTGAAAGDSVSLRSNGSDTSINLDLFTKGAGAIRLRTDRDGAAPTQFLIAHTNSAVNYLQVTGGVTGVGPAMTAQGADTNVSMYISAKGTGAILPQADGGTYFQNRAGASQFAVTSTASAVNYLQVTGNAAGNGPTLSSQGSDTNINMVYATKGAGVHAFYTGSSPQFVVQHVPSSVNYVNISGNSTGGAPTVWVGGSDTNVDLLIAPKGTGNVKFGTLTANADAPITGYITIKDSAGNLRKLAVIA